MTTHANGQKVRGCRGGSDNDAELMRRPCFDLDYKSEEKRCKGGKSQGVVGGQVKLIDVVTALTYICQLAVNLPKSAAD